MFVFTWTIVFAVVFAFVDVCMVSGLTPGLPTTGRHLTPGLPTTGRNLTPGHTNPVRHLTPNQWGSIRIILSNPATSPDIRQRTQRVIYAKYEDWAIHQAKLFKDARYALCRHIHSDELAIYAVRGLIKAIERCNYTRLGSIPFSLYAKKWVDGELLEGMTELQPMTVVPKSWRKRRGLKNRKSYLVIREPSGWSPTVPSEPVHPSSKETIQHLLEERYGNKDAFTKRSANLKYMCERVKTNAEVAEQMGCSAEYVRRKLSLE